MRFSVTLPRPGTGPGADVRSQAGFAAVVEDCGFHAVSATDHPFPVVGGDSVSHHAYDPFTLLAYLAAHTERIRLHFSILVAGYRNPFLAAQMIATLDEISAGRVIVAVGAGYNKAEFEALGSPFSDRGRRTDDIIAAMRTAWSGDPVHLEHPEWRAEGNTLFPAYGQRPQPPLWRGGNSGRARASAVLNFDGWAPLEANDATAAKAGTTGLTMRTIPETIASFRRQWEEAGRSGLPDIALVRARTDWYRDPERLVRETRQLEQIGVTWVELTPLGDSPQAVEADLRDAARRLREADLLTKD
jgi:probable F420-dependent oxidoreductase